MKFWKTMGKTALIAGIAVGALTDSVSAAQAIHPDYAAMNPQQVKRKASEMRNHIATLEHHIANPHLVIPQLEGTDTYEVMGALKAGNVDHFIEVYTESVGQALEHYIKTNLLPGANAAFLDATVANLANAAADANVVALITPHGGGAGAAYDAGGGWGTHAGGFVENEMPADLSRDAFIAALRSRMRQVDLARITHHHGHPFALPAHLDADSVAKLRMDIRDAIKADIGEWLDLMATGGAGADMLVAGIPNAAGAVALHAPDLTAAGQGGGAAGAAGNGLAVRVAARHAPQPADLHPGSIAAAFDQVIDFVNLF